MEIREDDQPVLDPIQREEQKENKELPLEDLDMPINQLLQMYKNREVPRRWHIEQ